MQCSSKYQQTFFTDLEKYNSRIYMETHMVGYYCALKRMKILGPL